MKHLSVLTVLLIFSLFVFACSDDSDDSDNSDIQYSFESYLPTEVGNKWTYTGYNGDMMEHVNIVNTIISRESNGSDEWPFLTSQYFDTLMNEMDGYIGEILLERDGNRLLHYEMPRRPYPDWIFWVEGTLENIGSTEVGDTMESIFLGSSNEYSFYNHFILFNKDTTVTVRAGTYENCIYMRRLGGWYTAQYHGGPADIILAPEIGMIKTIEYQQNNTNELIERSRYELLNFENLSSNNSLPTKPEIMITDDILSWSSTDADNDLIYYYIVTSNEESTTNISSLLQNTNEELDFPVSNSFTSDTQMNLSPFLPSPWFIQVIAYDFKGGSAKSDVFQVYAD